MKNWKETAISLGSLRAGEKKVITFESENVIENIKKITPSCDSCTEVLGYNPETKELKLEFSTREFPVHLSLEGKKYYDVNKNVTVFYQNNTSENLYFSARIYK